MNEIDLKIKVSEWLDLMTSIVICGEKSKIGSQINNFMTCKISDRIKAVTIKKFLDRYDHDFF